MPQSFQPLQPSGNRYRKMGRLWLVIFVLLVLLIGGGAVFLLFWDIPAPSQKVEKVLPDDAFPE